MSEELILIVGAIPCGHPDSNPLWSPMDKEVVTPLGVQHWFQI